MKWQDFADYIEETQDEPVRVFVCAGPPKCSGRPVPCPWCRVCVTDEDFENLEPMEH